jgi:hypothetical protein
MTTNNNTVPLIAVPAFTLVAIVSAELPMRVAWLFGNALYIDFKCESDAMDDCSFVARSEFDEYDLTLYPVSHSAVAMLKVRNIRRRNVNYLLRLSPAPNADVHKELCDRVNDALGLGYCYLVDNQ